MNYKLISFRLSPATQILMAPSGKMTSTSVIFSITRKLIGKKINVGKTLCAAKPEETLAVTRI